ncbi:MAG: PVC-type heme-binding CxxCH protein [Verrucomicrobiota bacterium]
MKHRPALPLLAALSVATPLAPFLSLAKDDSAPVEKIVIGPSAAGLTFEKWSATINVPDPVACSVDPQGRVYVASTARRKAADLDIREYPKWIPDDVGLKSIEEKAAFLRRELAPGKMRAPRGTFGDHNKDGSIDWKDLTAISDKILQLTDTDGDGVPDKITVFAEGFNTEVTGIAAGVLYHDGWVYATIAPDLWRFKDTDGDGVADVYEILAHGFGLHISYGGHDMHGLSVGPDGRIYWSIGDKGVNVTSKEGRKFNEPNQGCVLRIDPDGGNFEIYAHGLRNPQEPAFDDFGDLFAVDNDADFKGEKERFVYIPEGSDAGWRGNFQYMKERTPWILEGMSIPKWDGQAVYFLPPLAKSTDGPCGFKRDPGTALGKTQRGMFFLTEFPSGVLRGFRVEQNGASFKRSEPEVLHKGIMGTGLAWHPDGSLFSADWAKGYPLDGNGAIQRIESTDGGVHPLRKETAEILKAGFEKRNINELTSLLGHADQRVRMGAQFELVKRGESKVLLTKATDEKAALLSRLHALWGYGQFLRKNEADAIALLPLLKDKTSEIRAQVAKVLGESKLTPSQAEALIPLLSDSTAPRAQVQAALALGRLRVPAAVKSLFALAETTWDEPILRHAVFTGLTGCATAEQLAERKTATSLPDRLASVVALRRQASPLIAAFLQDKDPVVVNEVAHAIHDSDGIPEALPALAALIENRAWNAPTMLRAINAGLRLGTQAHAEKLLQLALDETAPADYRWEALASLLAWKQPPRLDRVDGFARTLIPQPIDDLLAKHVDGLLSVKGTELRQTAIEILVAYSLKAKPEQIAAIITDNKAPAEIRAEALRLMSGEQRNASVWPEALEGSLKETNPPVLQQAALVALRTENPARVASIVERILKKAPVSQKQHAIAQLALAAHADTDALLTKLGQSLLSGKAEPSLQFDILDALTTRGANNPELAALAQKYTTSEAGSEHRELLVGGDRVAGAEIVQNHLGANCMACHAVAETGSTVGPNLRSIGAQKERPYLLESLILPSAKLAPGYGLTMLNLKDGSVVSGAPLGETAEGVSIQLPDGTKKTVAKSDITSQTPPVSIMPPMLGILKPSEIRDAVEYLSTLKWTPKAKPAAEH